MVNILHNTPVVIVYVIVMAVCIITITALDLKRIRMIRKNTEAVKENTAIYNRVLDETVRDEKAREQHGMIVESYREAVNRNTRVYEKLIRLLEQERRQTGGSDIWKE